MNRDDPPPQFAPIQVRQMRASLPLFASEDGSILLPDLVLWAFHLNQGDLLTVSREESETFRCYFESYAEVLRTLAGWGPTVHWRFLEERLRLPMAAIASQGKLLLPDEAAPLEEPRCPLFLIVSSPLEKGFTLEPTGGRRISPGLFLEASYAVPLEAGVQVRLPEDVLWLASLREGDVLACRPSLGQADFEPFVQIAPLRGRTLVKLGLGGTLRVPDSFLRDLRPDWRIRLTVTFRPEAAFRLNYDVE